MVDKGAPQDLADYQAFEQDGFTFYVKHDLAEELKDYDVELSSIGVVFPRYFISSLREL